jgi:YggT family protein
LGYLTLNPHNPLCFLANLYVLVFFIRAVLSWFPLSPGSALVPVVRVLYRLTEPVLGIFRRFIPPVGVFDLSFLVAIIALEVVAAKIICPIGHHLLI